MATTCTLLRTTEAPVASDKLSEKVGSCAATRIESATDSFRATIETVKDWTAGSLVSAWIGSTCTREAFSKESSEASSARTLVAMESTSCKL